MTSKYIEYSKNIIKKNLLTNVDLSNETKINDFINNISSHLFFNKPLNEMINKFGIEICDIITNLSKIIIKIGALYITVTDLDNDGIPVINLNNVKLKKSINGKAKITMSDYIDYGDIEIPLENINNKIGIIDNSISDIIESDFNINNIINKINKVVNVISESTLEINSYSKKVTEMSTEIIKLFNNLWILIQQYPKNLKKILKFKNIISLITSSIFTGIMIFIILSVSKLDNKFLKNIIFKIFENNFIMSQLKNSVDLITDIIINETPRKCFCFKLNICCKKTEHCESIDTTVIDNDLSTILKNTEVNNIPRPTLKRSNNYNNINSSEEDNTSIFDIKNDLELTNENTNQDLESDISIEYQSDDNKSNDNKEESQSDNNESNDDKEESQSDNNESNDDKEESQSDNNESNDDKEESQSDDNESNDDKEESQSDNNESNDDKEESQSDDNESNDDKEESKNKSDNKK